jgi:hypothetical protein
MSVSACDAFRVMPHTHMHACTHARCTNSGRFINTCMHVHTLCAYKTEVHIQQRSYTHIHTYTHVQIILGGASGLHQLQKDGVLVVVAYMDDLELDFARYADKYMCTYA